jgi:hypothetical protein
MTDEHRNPSTAKDINQLVHDIANLTYIPQLSAGAAVHAKMNMSVLIANFTIKIRDRYLAQIQELERKLYLAEKAVEDAEIGGL